MKLPNFGMGVAALAISVAIWLYVQDQQALIATQTIKVDVATFFSEPESEAQYVLRRQPGPALIILKGNQENLDRFNTLYGLERRGQETYYTQDPANTRTRRLQAQVDLSRLAPEQETIRPERWNIPDLAELKISVEMPEIPILVEERERKSVSIEVNPINVSEQYQYDPKKSIVSPDAVFISGPKSLVNSVAKLVGTVDFSEYRPGSSLRVTRLQPQSAVGDLIPEVTVETTAIIVTPSLGPYMPRGSLLVVPVFVGKPAVGYRVYHFAVEPSTPVLATGPQATKIESLRTKPISIEGIRESSTRRKVDIVKPDGISRLSQETVDVRILVEKIPAIENQPPPTTPTTGATGAGGATGTTGTAPNE